VLVKLLLESRCLIGCSSGFVNEELLPKKLKQFFMLSNRENG
jgi:hypothetical protein